MNDVIEHFEYEAIIKILNTLVEKMSKGSCLCFQFPNMSSPFGLRNYYGDQTHQSALTDTKLKFCLSPISNIRVQFMGVEEIGNYGIISLFLGIIYWKFLIKIYKILFKGSIGWNKYFFYPNLFCKISKV